MAINLIPLVWVILISFIFQAGVTTEEKHMLSESYAIPKTKLIYAIVLFSVPFIIVAFRVNFIDTASYIRTFVKMSTNISDMDKVVMSADSSQLFYGIMFLFKAFIANDAQLFFALIALLQAVLIIATLRNYSEDLGLSVFLFVSSGMVLSWMCNGVKQFLAASILFACTKLLLKNKTIIYVMIAVLLMGIAPICNLFGVALPIWLLGGIHQSVLVLIIMIFFITGKPMNVKMIVLAVMMFFLIAFGALDSVLEASATNTMYTKDLELVANDTGTNPLRFVVSAVPITLVLIRWNRLNIQNIPKIISLSINMSFVSSILYLASCFTSGIFVGRLPVYFELYNLILYPWIINNLYKEDKRLFKILLYLFYTVYYLYQIFGAWGDQQYLINIFGFQI